MQENYRARPVGTGGDPAVAPASSAGAGRLHVTIVADDPARGALLREAILTTLPAARADVLAQGESTDHLRSGSAVIDGKRDGPASLDLLRRIRGGGFKGGLILVADDELVTREAAALGARCVGEDEIALSLPAAVVDATSLEDGEALRQLRRTQQLIAAGTVALRLQHSLNNPLAALLAEAQLLELEELSQEHRDAVARIVDLCRRVIALVRRLDGIADNEQRK